MEVKLKLFDALLVKWSFVLSRFAYRMRYNIRLKYDTKDEFSGVEFFVGGHWDKIYLYNHEEES